MTDSGGGNAVRSVRVAFEAMVGQYRREVRGATADTQKFRTTAHAAAAETKNVGAHSGNISALGAAFKGAASDFRGGTLGVLAGFAGISFGTQKIAHDLINYGQSVFKLQLVTGGSAEETSKLAFVMNRLGIDVDKAQRPLIFMSRNLENGNKRMTQYFTATELARLKTGDLTQAIPILQTAYNRLGTVTEKNAFLVNVLARGGYQLRRLIMMMPADYRRLADEAAHFGLVLSERNVQALKEFGDETRAVGQAFKGLELQIGLAVLPALKVLEKLTIAVVTAFNYLPPGLRDVVGGLLLAVTAFGLLFRIGKFLYGDIVRVVLAYKAKSAAAAESAIVEVAASEGSAAAALEEAAAHEAAAEAAIMQGDAELFLAERAAAAAAAQRASALGAGEAAVAGEGAVVAEGAGGGAAGGGGLAALGLLAAPEVLIPLAAVAAGTALLVHNLREGRKEGKRFVDSITIGTTTPIDRLHALNKALDDLNKKHPAGGYNPGRDDQALRRALNSSIKQTKEEIKSEGEAAKTSSQENQALRMAIEGAIGSLEGLHTTALQAQSGLELYKQAVKNSGANSKEAQAAAEAYIKAVVTQTETNKGEALSEEDKQKAVDGARDDIVKAMGDITSALQAGDTAAKSFVNTFDYMANIKLPATPEEAAKNLTEALNKLQDAQARVADGKQKLAKDKGYVYMTPERTAQLQKDQGDLAKAQQEVTDAQKAYNDALMAQRNPGKLIEDNAKKQVAAGKTFASNVKWAIDHMPDDTASQGFIAKALADPEKYGPVLEAMRKDTSGALTKTVHDTEIQLNQAAAQMGGVGTVIDAALQSGMGKLGVGVKAGLHKVMTDPQSQVYTDALALAQRILSGITDGLEGKKKDGKGKGKKPSDTAPIPGGGGSDIAGALGAGGGAVDYGYKRPAAPKAFKNANNEKMWERYYNAGGNLSAHEWWIRWGQYGEDGVAYISYSGKGAGDPTRQKLHAGGLVAMHSGGEVPITAQAGEWMHDKRTAAYWGANHMQQMKAAAHGQSIHTAAIASPRATGYGSSGNLHYHNKKSEVNFHGDIKAMDLQSFVREQERQAAMANLIGD